MKSFGKSGITLLVISVFIFGFAEVRGADCAWVLWEKIGGTTGSTDWRPVNAFPNYELCIKAQKDTFQKAKDFWKGCEDAGNCKIFAIPFEYVSVKVISKEQIYAYETFYTYKCFPDTIDPRK